MLSVSYRMKKLAFLLLFYVNITFGCQLYDEDSKEELLLMSALENPIVVVADIEETYHRKDECTVKRFCTDSGLKLKIVKIFKGNPPKNIDAIKAVYTSCYSDVYHPHNGTIDLPDGDFIAKGYEDNLSYLLIINKKDHNFIVMAGVLESESLEIQEKIKEVK